MLLEGGTGEYNDIRHSNIIMMLTNVDDDAAVIHLIRAVGVGELLDLESGTDGWMEHG